MSSRTLPHYLRSHRKAFGLTQKEVGRILGFKNGHSVCQFENFRDIPRLQVMLAYEVLFDTPASQLLAGISEAIRFVVHRRIRSLAAELSKRKPTPATAAKLAVLRAALERPAHATHTRHA
jgi:transcriptional regulator with XRE-family HTH domain